MSNPENEDELSAEIAAVEAARHRLVTDIDVLGQEARLEVLYRMETIAWKLVAGVAAATAGLGATKLLGIVWGKVVPDHEPPPDPTDLTTTTGDAVLWTALTGVGVGIATVLAQRAAAKGWSKATGRVPPPYEKKASQVKVK